MKKIIAFLFISLNLMTSAKDLSDLKGIPQSGPEPILMLSENNQPLVEPVLHEIRMDYYECNGVVGGWFQELLRGEMRYLEGESKLRNAKYNSCVVGVSSDLNVKQGKFVVSFFESLNQRNSCILKRRCDAIRNVTLVPKNGGVYRSYFLTDLKKVNYFQYCVNNKGKLFTKTTCFTIDNETPDNH